MSKAVGPSYIGLQDCLEEEGIGSGLEAELSDIALKVHVSRFAYLSNGADCKISEWLVNLSL